MVIYGINYAPELAGVGHYSGEIGEHFAAEGRSVCVVTAPPHYPGWRVDEGYSATRWMREEIAGVTIYRCPLYLNTRMGGLRRLLTPLTFALSSAPVACLQILRRRPHVVLAVEPTLFSAPLALLAARLVGAKTVLHIQDLEVEAAFAVGHLRKGGALSALARLYDRLVTRSFDRIITISFKMAERIQRKGVAAEKIHIVRNWVDLEQVGPGKTSQAYRRELGLRPDDFVILYSGSIGAKQGVGLLIDAARRLQDQPDVVFAIAGQGPMRGEVEAAARDLPNLRLFDFAPEARYGEFLSVADAHVLPQEREVADLMLPSKLGGMLASGRQCLVTAEAGTELADFLGESCILTPPGDAEALARAVMALRHGVYDTTQEAERLRRAATLSKTAGLKAFSEAALGWPQSAEAFAPAAQEA